MATNIITTSNSRTTQLSDDEANAFLLVNEGAYITTNAVTAYVATSTGLHATIAGTVVSAFGIGVQASGDSVITVAASGIIGGDDAGLSVTGGNNTVTNAGLIYAGSDITDPQSGGHGIDAVGNYNVVRNTGTITGAIGIYNDGIFLDVTNSGVIMSDNYFAIQSTGIAIIRNTGQMTGSISTIDAVSLLNDGLISGSVIVSNVMNYISAVQNHGEITGSVSLGLAPDMIDNYGTMGGIISGDGNDQVTNSGTVNGVVDLGYTGTAYTDDDTFTNTGRVIGALFTEDGDDTIDTSAGTIIGVVDLGAGNDTYTGGASVDRVTGGVGNDDIDLGAGNDVYRAGNGDGKDTIEGGDGIDRYDASATTQAVTVDLGAGSSAGTVNGDLLTNFENVTGGVAGDTLTGSDGVNRIDGGGGADKIDGGAGADRLIGGTGADIITGGAGRDIMTGGQPSGSTDSDTFVFLAGDSGTTGGTRDVITDFTDHGHPTAPFNNGADLIDLSAIDANTGVAGDQMFSFNATKGVAFSGTAGSLIWQQYGAFALISGDVNGDKIADFTIQLNGTHTLFASDFVL